MNGMLKKFIKGQVQEKLKHADKDKTEGEPNSDERNINRYLQKSWTKKEGL